jgi:hypothetical protein
MVWLDGRIHCSQATADQLTIAGKEHWLVKREDLIKAKGKGTMQTYWVDPFLVQSSVLRNITSNRDEYQMIEMEEHVDLTEITDIHQRTGANAGQQPTRCRWDPTNDPVKDPVTTPFSRDKQSWFH